MEIIDLKSLAQCFGIRYQPHYDVSLTCQVLKVVLKLFFLTSIFRLLRSVL